MEFRWIVFVVLCLGLGWIVRGYFGLTKKTTRKDLDHALSPPEVSSYVENSASDAINHQ